MSDESEEKTDKASAQKLRKQRKDGVVANGQEITNLMSCAAGLLTLAVTSNKIWASLVESIHGAHLLFHMPFQEAAIIAAVTAVHTVALAVGPTIGVMFITGFICTMLFNNGFVFSLKPASPQLNRVSPTAGIKRIFGRRGWMELGVSTLRLIVWLLVATLIGFVWLPRFLASPACADACTLDIALPLVGLILVAAFIVLVLSAAMEAIVQKNQFLHEQRMTKTEVKREGKEQNGSPEVRKERNRLRNEAKNEATKPGAENGNMCFFGREHAVIIRYLPPNEKIPFVVAKASSAKEVAEMRKGMTGAGRTEIAAADLAKFAGRTELGSALDPKHYDLFVDALKQAFG